MYQCCVNSQTQCTNGSPHIWQSECYNTIDNYHYGTAHFIGYMIGGHTHIGRVTMFAQKEMTR